MNRILFFGRVCSCLAEFKRTWICSRLLAAFSVVVFCCAASAQETTGRVHAVIINGGMNKLMNHERYWNDCAFLYRTLREDLHFSKQDITLLISDGGEPGRDMLLADGSGFATSPADLDGDGERDVWLPATLAQVDASLTELAARLTSNDRLFLFMIDHGDFDNSIQQSYAWMWGGGRLFPTHLAQLLEAFHVESISLCLGLCHSGGFIEELRRENRIIATSCAENEESWACTDRPYDEFVYHWTCAVAGHDSEGNVICADTDGDGYVSMAEAFDYAYQHDRREETPLYCSMPTTLGESWWLLQTQGNGINERKIENGISAPRKYYDLQGRIIPVPSGMQGKTIKKLKAKQSFLHSPIIIIKP